MLRYRVIYWVLFVVPLLVGCHHKDKPTQPQTPTDSAVSIATNTESQNIVDKSDKFDKSISSEQTDYQLQTDTAPRTDWRISARKQSKIYSPALLSGEWRNGNLHQQYRSDGTGLRWDEADDVSHSEGQAFSWVMDCNCLTMIFPMELGGVVPKEYVVTFADEETLVYKDAYGTSYMWDKVPQGINLGPQ